MADEGWKASLLPGNATPLLEAVSLTSAARYPLPAYLLKTIDDPWLCPEHLLAYCAHHYSVDLWSEGWSTEQKRIAIDRQIHLAPLKGTQVGIEGYVEIAGSKVLEVMAPPQGMFMGADPTKAEMDAYLSQLPAIRIYLDHNKGQADAGLYWDDGFWDEDCLPIDLGPALYGRRAVLFADGEETPLRMFGIDTAIESRAVTDVERVVIPGLAGPALFFDDGYWDDAGYDLVEKEATVVSYRLDRSYDHQTDTLWYSTVSPGFDPVEPRYERVSAIGNGGAAMFFDADFWDDGFAVADANLMFDQLRLFDPSIGAPLGTGNSFWDDARWDMAPFTAEVMILTERVADRGEGFWDIGFWDDFAMVPANLDLQELALDAVALAKEHHAKVLVTFETTRPIRFGDQVPLDGSFTFDSRVRAHL